MSSGEIIIKPTEDVFIASLLSAPKNVHLLTALINAVIVDSGCPPVVEATVLNPFSIAEYSGDKRIVLDVRVRDETNRL
ncbi:MAG: Rpn family recombination-promoting nuclease/putative transposase, partial [Planctomycetaceae bacterium]|nr:Rpn family recombination-promoting nuclease/putative transposase [Planctomycetaceae bacterium]